MNLILAIVWLIAAVLFFVWSFKEPDNPYNKLFGTELSLGWIAIVMVAYNLVRWWNWKQYYSQKQPINRSLPPRPMVKRDEDEDRPKE